MRREHGLARQRRGRRRRRRRRRSHPAARLTARVLEQARNADYITFTSSSDGAGHLAIDNDIDGRSYVCTVVFDNPNDSFDCTTGPHAGLQGTVTGLGLHGDWCTGKDFGNIAVAVDGAQSPTNESCAFGCGIAP